MSEVAAETSKALQMEIQKIEHGSDLKRVAVISRIGMKIACATSSQMDADAETASSSALVELADRFSSSLQHGNLREIVVKSDSGYIILQFINNQYMLFGGIENLLRVGFYLEYLRKAAHKFAYILAGNTITEELKHEIEVNRNRDQRLQEEKNAPLAADFKMDKDTSQDLNAMEGVLSFLQEWGEDEQGTKVNEQNIVSIDQDLTFGLSDLEPEPISQEKIQQAQQADPSMDDSLADLAQLAAELSGEEPEVPQFENKPASKTTPKPTPFQPPTNVVKSSTSNEDEGLPDDILASLGNIAEKTEVQESIPTASKPIVEKTKYQFGIPLYDGEVPPTPLNDYVNFEIGTLTSQDELNQQTATFQEPIVEEKVELKLNAKGEPDFNTMSSEYDDLSLDNEEDAMLMALEELNLTDTPPKKKSAKEDKKNPFLL